MTAQSVALLLERAQRDGYLDEDDVRDLQDDDFQDVLGAVYGIIINAGDDPDTILQSWGVIAI